MSNALRIHAIADQVISVLKPWNPSLDDLCSVFALLLADQCEIISHAPGTESLADRYRQLAVLYITDRIELFAAACAESWRLGEQAKALDPTNTGDVLPTPDAKGRFTENLNEAEDVANGLIAGVGAKTRRKPG